MTRGHLLDPLVQEFGSQEAAGRAIVDAISTVAPESGRFIEVPVEVGGQTVLVSGEVIDGVVKVGTAATPP
jgi:hypothetical protein